MTQSLDVEIDESGQLHLLQPEATLPRGRARLVWDDAVDQSSWELSKPAFAEDWLTPEEDEAWAHLQLPR